MLQKRAHPPPEVVNMGDFANMPTPTSLTGSISSQRSYGATRLNIANAEMKFLSHEVENGDTLQRIAVRYNVPVERLKQLNKIWSNESLFLLKKLKIPYIKHTSNWEDYSDDEGEAACQIEDEVTSENGVASMRSDSKLEANCTTTGSRGEQSDNPDDFFSKIDSQITKCKEDWTKIRSHSHGSGGIPNVSYDSADLNRVMSPTKRYKHFGEQI